ncbi:MAG: DUF2283 domain-containing protein [Chloroflexota bacterium]|nr:DUF2283 domain-containing protein [Chloroflexota bacterium]
MKIDYDPQADAIYVQLKEGAVADTLDVSKYIFVDVDEKGIPLGIEILFVSRHLDMEDLTTVTLNIGKAAELVGAGS